MPEQEKAFHAAGATEKQWIGKPHLLYAVVRGWRANAGGGMLFARKAQGNFTAEA